MKVILSSLKTLNWFKALVAVSACASLILFHSCRKDELKSELNMEQKDFQDLQGMNFRPRSGSISNSLKIYFGPEKFIAGSTKPFLESQSLSNPDFENYMDFFIRVQNGDGGNTKVNKMEISIDGTLILTQSDFRKNAKTVTKQLTNLGPASILEVKLDASKGRYIRITIEATAKELADIEGNVYKTVKIGSQWWMAENLKTTRYNDGSPIPNITGNPEWESSYGPAYCWYDNDIANKDLYGALYNTYAAFMGADVENDRRQICPTGWHVPLSRDWYMLMLTLDPDAIENANPASETAGGKLKEAGTSHWLSPNTGATNESGFTALPAGKRHENGIFMNKGEIAWWWGDAGTSIRSVDYNSTYVGLGETNNNHGFSVRCVRN